MHKLARVLRTEWSVQEQGGKEFGRAVGGLRAPPTRGSREGLRLGVPASYMCAQMASRSSCGKSSILQRACGWRVDIVKGEKKSEADETSWRAESLLIYRRAYPTSRARSMKVERTWSGGGEDHVVVIRNRINGA